MSFTLFGWLVASALALAGCVSASSIPSSSEERREDEYRLPARSDLPLAERTLVVMIHGWGGDPHDTWLEFPRLLDETLPNNFDIASFGYRSGLKPGSPSLEQLSQYLHQWLQREGGRGNNAGYGSYVIIAHSFGGLLTKRHVVNELTLGRRLKVDVVFLIGTPNLGDDISRLAVYIPFIPKAQLQRLQDDDYLADLHQRYLIHTGIMSVDNVNPAVVQRLKTIAIFGKADRDGDGVVNLISAQAFFPESRIVFKDHVSLVGLRGFEWVSR